MIALHLLAVVYMTLTLFKRRSWTLFLLRFLIWIDALYMLPVILGNSFFYYSINYDSLTDILFQKTFLNLVLYLLLGRLRFEEISGNHSQYLSLRVSNLLLTAVIIVSISGFSGLGILSGESYGSGGFGVKNPLSEYAILLLAAVRLFGKYKTKIYFVVGGFVFIVNFLSASRVGIVMLLILISFDLENLVRKGWRYILVPGFLLMEALGAIREGIQISAASLLRGFVGDAVSTQSQVLNGSVILSKFSFSDFVGIEAWLLLPFRFILPGSFFPLALSPVDNIIRLEPWAGGGDYFIQLMYFSEFLVLCYFLLIIKLRSNNIFLVGFSLGFVRFLYYDVFAPTRFVFLLYLVWMMLQIFRPLSSKKT